MRNAFFVILVMTELSFSCKKSSVNVSASQSQWTIDSVGYSPSVNIFGLPSDTVNNLRLDTSLLFLGYPYDYSIEGFNKKSGYGTELDFNFRSIPTASKIYKVDLFYPATDSTCYIEETSLMPIDGLSFGSQPTADGMISVTVDKGKISITVKNIKLVNNNNFSSTTLTRTLSSGYFIQ